MLLRRSATALAVASAVLGLPATAPAIDPALLPDPICASAVARYYAGGLPRAGTGTIVPGRSMAGVAIGARPARLIERWGVPFEDGGDGSFWMRGTIADGCVPHRSGSYAQALVGDRVRSLAIVRDGPLMRGWRTASGIGLGSAAAAVRRAYPEAQPDVDQEYTPYGDALVLAGGTVREPAITVFWLMDGRVETIIVRAAG